jgi:hypothetical protein
MRPLRPNVRITGRTVEFTSRDVIAENIAQQEAGGEGFRVPLFRAAQAGLLAVATVIGGEPVISWILKRQKPTAVVLLDDQPSATGPDAWPQARKLARWAHLVALHATGGQVEHYAHFAQHAVRHGRLLIVEIELRHLDAWRDLIRLERKPSEILCLTPRPGGQHPVSPAQAGECIH